MKKLSALSLATTALLVSPRPVLAQVLQNAQQGVTNTGTNPFGNRGLQPTDLPYQVGTGADANSRVLTNLEAFISQILGSLTVIAAIFFIIYFLLGAYKWIGAGGDAGKIQKARDQIVQGVLGLVVIVAAYSIIGLIGRVVGLNILQPAAALRMLIPSTTTP